MPEVPCAPGVFADYALRQGLCEKPLFRILKIIYADTTPADATLWPFNAPAPACALPHAECRPNRKN